MTQEARRKIVKGLAFTLPAAWVAPVVDSVLLPVHAQTSPEVDPSEGDDGCQLSCGDILVEILVTTEPIPINSTSQQITAQVRVTNNGCEPYDTTGKAGSSDTPTGFNFGLNEDFNSIGVLNPGETGTSAGVTDDINMCDAPGDITNWSIRFFLDSQLNIPCDTVAITVACDIEM